MNYISLFIKKLIQYLFIKHIYLFINIQLKTIILLFFLIIVPFYFYDLFRIIISINNKWNFLKIKKK